MDDPTKQSSQVWLPDRYAHNAGFVSELGRPLLGLLAPKSGERILDLGCGDGTLLAELVAAGCGAVGVDSSPEQIAAVRQRGLDGRVVDGQRLPFEREFDAVLSNAALHWMGDADAVIRGVARALRPGGRFVAECGGAGNIATILAALSAALERRGIDARSRSPWHFRDADTYRDALTAAGFEVESCHAFARPTPLSGDLVAWLETFADDFAHALPEAERTAYRAEVQAACAPALRQSDGRWVADYVRVRFVARLPAASPRTSR
jgi:SAM-dependent methyltransferase